MSWKKVTGGDGAKTHWSFRPGTAPLCALYQDETKTTWCASLLHLSGEGATMMHAPADTVEEAQRICEAELRLMGWTWGPRGKQEGNEECAK